MLLKYLMISKTTFSRVCLGRTPRCLAGFVQAKYHEEFRKLFEEEMADFISEEGCTQADFVAVLTRAHAEREPGSESESCARFVWQCRQAVGAAITMIEFRFQIYAHLVTTSNLRADDYSDDSRPLSLFLAPVLVFSYGLRLLTPNGTFEHRFGEPDDRNYVRRR